MEVWRMFRGQRKETNKLIKIKHNQKETRTEYLQSLFVKSEELQEPPTSEIVINEEFDIDASDITVALKKLK